MGVFAPFSYLEVDQVIVPPSWQPDDFANVQYWWRADLSVTTGTGGVTSWVDQINSFDLQQSDSAERPSSSTSSNLNNREVISFNGTTDYLWTTSKPAQLSSSDLTILSVIDLVDVKTGGIVSGVSLFANGTRFWIDTNSGFRVVGENIFSGGVSSTSIENPASTGANAFKLRYDASAGDGYYAQNTLTETSLGTSGDVNADWNTTGDLPTVALGAGVNNTGGTVFGSRYVQVDVAEQVFIYGTPSSGEMDNWKTYVNTRYGTIIS